MLVKCLLLSPIANSLPSVYAVLPSRGSKGNVRAALPWNDVTKRHKKPSHARLNLHARYSVSYCLHTTTRTCANMAALLESTSLPVTSLYAGLLSILFALLALRIGLTRAGTGVMHGDGGKQDLVRKARVSTIAACAHSSLIRYLGPDGDGLFAMQAQGNLAEYLPPFLILFGLCETNKILSPFFLHVVGTLFLVARVGHASQLSFPDSVPKKARELGFLSTAGTLFILAGLNAGYYLTSA